MKKITTILLVDDDLDDRDLFIEALSTIDGSIKMEFAANGLDALRLLESGKVAPDAIFSDINMPLMNGIQMLEKIHDSSRLCILPVIMYTTSSSQTYRSQTKMLGARDYIIKPTSFEKICSEIRNALDQIRRFSSNGRFQQKWSFNQASK